MRVLRVLCALCGLICLSAEPAPSNTVPPEHLDLAPNAGPEILPEPESWWSPTKITLFVGVGVTILGVAFYLLRPRKPIPPLKPHDWANRELDRLAESPPLSAREAVARAADILRRYLELRFAIRAPDMTTPELLRAIGACEGLAEEPKQRIERFFKQVDEVKFAMIAVETATAAESADTVRAFVKRTIPPSNEPLKAVSVRRTTSCEPR